jgi:enoyl-CoA hydratase
VTPQHLRVETVDGIRTITIDRPEVRNALTRRMRDDLCAHLDGAEHDHSVRTVVLTAVDPVFSAGVDFKEAAAPGTRVAPSPVNPGAALRAMSKPVVCAVNGACVSGALEIALSSTFVVASVRARFADTHARLGVVATWGLTALLPRAVGVRRAAEMSITGNFVDADEALRIGLVNHVVAHEELLPFTATLAHDIASTGAVSEVIRLYRRGEGMSLADALALETEHTRHRAFDAAAFGAAGKEAAARASGREPGIPASSERPIV